TLPPEARDRPLMGPWAGHRECRVGRGRLLIYRIEGELLVLTLTRTGTSAALYENGGVNAMKKSTSLRMLLRSPVKTAVTLLLIAAASFLFLYNLLDYAMTKRNYDRTYSQYHGYLSLLHPEDRLLGETSDWWMQRYFFISDPASDPAYTGDYPEELYHLRSFTGEEMEKLTSMPYVSRAEKHYMTGGITDFPRRFYYTSMGCYARINYASRVILEGTYDGMEPNLERMDLPSIYGTGVYTNLRLKDVKLISGNEEELKQNRLYINRNGLYIRVYATIPARADNEARSGGRLTDVGPYTKNWISTDTVLSLEKGRRYLFVACIDTYSSGSRIGEEESAATNPYTYLGDDSLYGVCDYITLLDGEPENYLETEKFAGVRQMMEIMEADRYTLDVHYLEDIRGIKRYQDGTLQSTRGRMLTREDSLEHNPVCVIPESMAERQGLELGDTLRLRLGDKLLEQYVPMGAVGYSVPRYAENWTEQEFTIVGTFTEGGLNRLPVEESFWAFGDNAVLVPLSFLPETADTENYRIKPTDITFVIDDADSIIPFRDEVLPQLLEAGYTVSFTDGGWPAVREQLSQAGSLGLVKLCAFALSAILVLCLTVYLYILRKKKEFAVMRALGCPTREARKSLLFPLLTLAVPAVLLGSVAAALYTRGAAEQNAAEFADMGLAMDTSVPLPILLAGFGGSLLLLLLLAWAALGSVAKKPPLELLQGSVNRNLGKRKELPPELTEEVALAPLPVLEPPVYGEHTAVRHTLGYIGKHLRRTPAKALLSLLLSLVLCFSIGYFTLLRDTYRDLYQNIEVHPRFLNGFSDNRARDVEKSGYVRDPYYEYKRTGCESNFVEDTLILTSDISRVTDAEIVWREDKGPDVFAQSHAFCVVSRELADELGYTLGSRAEICSSGYIGVLWQGHPTLNDEELIAYYHEYTHHFTVAGIAEEEGKTFYAPVAARRHFGSMFSDYIPLDLAEFTLNDYHKATEFRSWVFRLLVGRPGSFSMETQEADRIYQTYRLLELLYPIAFALALILGGVLPAGVILQSAREASLLRVLGTTKRRTRAMLSLEQLFLCFIGLCLAVAALVLTKGSALLAVAGL
ncbi:MAG: type II toxin-antitoxin system mRNA interferase toxin, RelE/StbE family, partial [Oscillospiraceae bacterium]|nr:type II toxin-antitoxin system mRNA interferase toxin, RelE/StbE family [Oscillospiraceae bacterium]